ncbi:hypothetical protein [Sodalis sp. RH20]|uniref:hypothetical protein n=1 Tax=unclassified Sodalis (in: enterobacteria) TaxID=2636512 RepID=UPI0039B41331
MQQLAMFIQRLQKLAQIVEYHVKSRIQCEKAGRLIYPAVLPGAGQPFPNVSGPRYNEDKSHKRSKVTTYSSYTNYMFGRTDSAPGFTENSI